ncbi:MAG: ThiF family adenylyltransferase [Candidatus Binatia bacterium]|jgi:molybdopterin/thiamine biosynthesis adenylyltransferase
MQSVVVVGCGAIGSHLVPHLGRMPGMGRVVLIDHDMYEEKNLCSQDITRRDLDRPKAVVQAHRLRRVNPALKVIAVADAVENVPLGQLRANVILACLDSRAARRHVNRIAWRLGVPWIDSGVQGEDLLARVNVYVPQAHQPCLECAWDERDYQTLEQTYPCSGGSASPQPTNSPSSLGALAASLLALECEKVLAGRWEWAAVGRQVLINASGHKHYVTRFGHNPACRFDHTVWRIETVDQPPDKLTVAGVLALVSQSNGRHPSALRIPGQAFVRQLTCHECGQTRAARLRLIGRMRTAERRCGTCGGEMRGAGFDMIERLNPAELPEATLERSLRSFGIRSGDVVTLSTAEGERHFEIGTGEVEGVRRKG